MMIYAVGINHRSAPVDLRERVHLSPEEIASALTAWKGTLFREACIVSTCNRTEIYGIPAGDDIAGDDMIAALRRIRPAAGLEDVHFFRAFSCGAVAHLFRIAASIDSQILGDMQILGQVKESYEIARTAGTIGNVLNHLFMGALHTGKRVRAETGVGIGAVSISFAAAELAKKIFTDLHRKTILLIGTGETGALAARHLIDKGAEHIILTNRTLGKAEALARELRAQVVPFEEFESALRVADIVIGATSAPGTIVSAEMIRRARRHRQNHTLLAIDIAMPRDIEPAAGDLPNVFLKDLDALQGIVDQNLERRLKEVPKADIIVTEEVVNFFLWFNALDATPTIQQLREKFELIRRNELEKFRHRIDATDRELIEQLTKRIVNKLLHPTMVSLKQPVFDARVLNTRLQVLRDVFDLGEEKDDAGRESAEKEQDAA